MPFANYEIIGGPTKKNRWNVHILEFIQSKYRDKLELFNSRDCIDSLFKDHYIFHLLLKELFIVFFFYDDKRNLLVKLRFHNFY